jgi:hypothetical protein
MILASNGIIGSQIASFDADALAFFARVTAAGGTLSLTEKTAVNKLVLDLKANSLWTPMKAIYPMVGASAAACAQNLKSSSFTGTFTSGWTFASGGVTPNGTSAYMDTFLVCDSVLTYGSASIAYYSRTNSDGNFSDIGSYGDALNSFKSYCVQCRQSTNLGRSAIYDGSVVADWATLSVTDSRGFFLANRQSTTNNKMIKNNTAGAVNTVDILYSAKSNPNSSYVGAANNFGAIQYTNRQCAFASIGDGLTDTQASKFYTAVQAFQTTLSRNV